MDSKAERRAAWLRRTAHLAFSDDATLDFWEWSHEDGAEEAVASWVRAHGAIEAGLFQTTERSRPRPEQHPEPHHNILADCVGREWSAIGNLVP